MWTKLYSTGETISEPASWSNTSLVNMTGATLVAGSKTVEIHGVGKYWQSDTYIVDSGWGTLNPRLIKRRISKYLDIIHVGRIEINSESLFRINFDGQVDNHAWELVMFDAIPTWFVAEINIQLGTITTYLSKDRI